MGSIQTGIEMQDQFSSVLMSFINNMTAAVTAANSFSDVMNQNINTGGLSDVRSEIQSVAEELNALNQSAELPISPTVSAQVQSVQQFNEQIEQTQGLLQRVSNIQQQLNTESQGFDVLPDDVQMKIQGVNNSILEMQAAMDQISQNPFDMPAEAVEAQLTSLQSRIRQTVQEQLALNETLSNMDIEIEQPPPVQIPVEWQTDNLDVFTSTGVDRFRQEAESANAMLEQLSDTQNEIARQAFNTNILPPSAFRNMNTLATRIDLVKGRIQQIENNPLNMATDRANSELEQLRLQLSQAVAQQNEMNSAIDRMDVQSANSAYLQLSQTISNTERYIRDNVNEQGKFNEVINEGKENANSLFSTIKGAIAAYATINTAKSALNASDELIQTRSRLNVMNDGLQSTEDLVNMAYIAAQDARGEFGTMASVIARFGNNAKDAFSSSAEVVQFAGLVQKQMTIAGASTSEASNAMLQLSQALGSGVLRGDELNSIFENAPNLIRNIADYLHVPIGEIREMAADGEISADIVKNAIFAATDDINAKFNSMPMTWGQVWTSMQNTATMAFQPVLQRLNNIANSEQFQVFSTNAINAMATVAGILLQVFSLIGTIGQFAADHWDILSPIIYTVVGALMAYALYLGITNAISLISNGIRALMTIGMLAYCAATGTAVSVTLAEAAAQQGLNAALLACPLTWVILLVIALIAVIVALANNTANMGIGVATTFGAIVGTLYTVKAAFMNLGIDIANVFLGIGNAVAALGSNIATAFYNGICQAKSLWYGLLSTALTVVESICQALNKLPFIEFDYSGIANAADDYAAKSAEAAGSRKDYRSVADAFHNGMSTFERVSYEDEYWKGAAKGDEIAEKVSRAVKGIKTDIPDLGDYSNAVASSGNRASEIAKNTGDTAKSAQKAAQSLDINGENLKYIKDMAERDYINRFTTAKITVKQTNHNNVNNNMDLDGINEYLRSDLEQRMAATAEGVH